jgi:hypothetical protein
VASAKCASCPREQPLPENEQVDFLISLGWVAAETGDFLCPFCNPDPEAQKRLRRSLRRKTTSKGFPRVR